MADPPVAGNPSLLEISCVVVSLQGAALALLAILGLLVLGSLGADLVDRRGQFFVAGLAVYVVAAETVSFAGLMRKRWGWAGCVVVEAVTVVVFGAVTLFPLATHTQYDILRPFYAILAASAAADLVLLSLRATRSRLAT